MPVRYGRAGGGELFFQLAQRFIKSRQLTVQLGLGVFNRLLGLPGLLGLLGLFFLQGGQLFLGLLQLGEGGFQRVDLFLFLGLRGGQELGFFLGRFFELGQAGLQLFLGGGQGRGVLLGGGDEIGFQVLDFRLERRASLGMLRVHRLRLFGQSPDAPPTVGQRGQQHHQADSPHHE